MANEPTIPEATPEQEAAMQAAIAQAAQGGPMQITLEEAHAEACRTIGEQQITIRLLSQRVQILTQMLQQTQQDKPAANRQQRRATARKNGKQPEKPDLAPVK